MSLKGSIIVDNNPKTKHRSKKGDTMRTKLVSVRKKAGYTQAALADAVGISRNHYTQIETGDKNPSLPVAVKIKAKLCYKGDDIFFNSTSPKTGQSKR